MSVPQPQAPVASLFVFLLGFGAPIVLTVALFLLNHCTGVW